MKYMTNIGVLLLKGGYGPFDTYEEAKACADDYAEKNKHTFTLNRMTIYPLHPPESANEGT